MDRQGWGGVIISIGGAAAMGAVPVYDPALAMPAIAAGVMILVAGVVVALWGRPPRFPTFASMWSIKARDALPFRQLLPVKTASRIALDQLQGTKVGRAAYAVSPDDPLGYMYHLLNGEHHVVELWGERPLRQG